jgi:hypothetical protein
MPEARGCASLPGEASRYSASNRAVNVRQIYFSENGRRRQARSDS